jgi:four helix bundle protein
MAKENVVKQKSFRFAIRIVKLYKHLVLTHKEYVLPKQLLRSGTSVGAQIVESENAQSRADFIHKLSISQKEIDETIYWLDLLKETDYLSESEHASIYEDANELKKLLTAILKKLKSNPKV